MDRPPPLTVLIDLAWRAIEAVPGGRPGSRIAWVGRWCWPYPPALVRRDETGAPDLRLLDRSVFIDARSQAERVWTLDQVARCIGIAAAVGDGRGLAMAESRRLQLAASVSHQTGVGSGVSESGVPVLLARSADEQGELSAARTRWRVAPASEMTGEPHHQEWAVELLRCKGLRPEEIGSARRWAVRRDHATGARCEWNGVRHAGDGGLAADVVNGPLVSARGA